MFRNRQKHGHRVLALIALFFVASQFIIALSPGTASATPATYTWLDHTTIQGSDGSLWIMKAGDVTTYETTSTPTAQCQSNNINLPNLVGYRGASVPPTIEGGKLLSGTGRSSAKLITYSPSNTATNTNCQPTTSDITISNPIGHNLQFYWADSNTIVRIAGYDQTPAATYARSAANSNIFVESTSNTCKDSIAVVGDSGSYIGRSPNQNATRDVSWTQSVKDLPNNAGAHWYGHATVSSGGGCWQTEATKIPIVTLSAAALTTQAAVTSINNNSGSSQPTCESNGFSLSWIMCPIVNGLASAANGIYTSVVQPLLVTPPLGINSTSHSDQIFKAWSTFRVYGDIFLVIALIVTVFGQTIGGGFIDAYTAKKIIPRVLLAAILINLSYYIVGFLMDVTNVIGLGLVSLITAPFGLSGDFNISLNGGASFILSTGLAAGAGLAILSFGALLELLWTVVLIPTILAFLATAVTLLFRKGLLIFLVLISPVAFALYVLPNTEKYFKQWWNLLIKTLMVFPIVAALFGVSKVLAYTLDWANATSGPVEAIAGIMSVVALIIPLFLIPFAFKIAGGVIGQVANLASTATKKAQELGYFKHGRERAQLKAKGLSLQRKQNTYANLQKAASNNKNGFLKRKGAGLLAKSISGYNLEAEMSSERSRVGKEMGDQIGAGVDQQVRGITVNKTLAKSRGELNAANKFNNGLMRIEKDAAGNKIVQYKSLGGGWVNEAEVDAGQARWGKSTFAQQFALSYEMSKATTEEQAQDLSNNYSAVATGPGGWGNTGNQAGGSWVGASFQNQNQHLAYKHTNWDTGSFIDSNGKSRSEGFVDEIYEKKGSYPLAQMSSFTIEKLKQAYAASSNDDEKKKIAAIAETFMHEMSSGGQIGVTEGDNSQPIINPDGTPGRRQAGSAGSAHVAERVRELAVMAGVYGAGPSGYYPVEHDKNTPPPVSGPPTASGTTLTSNSSEQK